MTYELLTSENFLVTAGIAVAALAMVAFLAWRDRRPRTDLRTSLIPTVPVMLFSGIVALLAIVHLVNLLGLHTGR